MPTVPKNTSRFKIIGGLGEVGLSMASGAVAEPLSGFAGLGALAQGKSLEEAGQAVQGVQETLTYTPKTEHGKQYMQNMGELVEPVMTKAEQALTTAGDYWAEKTGSPDVGAVVHSLPLAALEMGIVGKVVPPISRQYQKVLKKLGDEGYIEVHHGSPHKIDPEVGLSTKHIGSGEGVQAFGWGLYTSEQPGVAVSYAKMRSEPIIRNNGKAINYDDLDVHIEREARDEFMRQATNDPEFIQRRLSDAAAEAWSDPDHPFWDKIPHYREDYLRDPANPTIDDLNNGYTAFQEDIMAMDPEDAFDDWHQELADGFDEEGWDVRRNIEMYVSSVIRDLGDKLMANPDSEIPPFLTGYPDIDELFEGGKLTAEMHPGYLYKVTLHKGKDPSEYNYMDWHKPAGHKERAKIRVQINKEGMWDQLSGDVQHALNKPNTAHEGQRLYKELSRVFGSDKGASKFLKRAGIDGIRYPVGTLTAGGKPSKKYNYVTFAGKDMTIEEVKQVQ